MNTAATGETTGAGSGRLPDATEKTNPATWGYGPDRRVEYTGQGEFARSPDTDAQANAQYETPDALPVRAAGADGFVGGAQPNPERAKLDSEFAADSRPAPLTSAEQAATPLPDEHTTNWLPLVVALVVGAVIVASLLAGLW